MQEGTLKFLNETIPALLEKIDVRIQTIEAESEALLKQALDESKAFVPDEAKTRSEKEQARQEFEASSRARVKKYLASKHAETVRLATARANWEGVISSLWEMFGLADELAPLVSVAAEVVRTELLPIISPDIVDGFLAFVLDLAEVIDVKVLPREMKIWAGQVYLKRDALVQAGFTKEEAMQITLASLPPSPYQRVSDALAAAQRVVTQIKVSKGDEDPDLQGALLRQLLSRS